jgi:hypothetical protein
MRYGIIIGLILALAVAAQVNADCLTDQYGNVVCGKGQCERDQHGKVFCAGLGGGAVKDRYGDVKCGVGYCAQDNSGQVWCSTEPGGGAAIDAYGKVKCQGGCEAGTSGRCESTH